MSWLDMHGMQCDAWDAMRHMRSGVQPLANTCIGFMYIFCLARASGRKSEWLQSERLQPESERLQHAQDMSPRATPIAVHMHMMVPVHSW